MTTTPDGGEIQEQPMPNGIATPCASDADAVDGRGLTEGAGQKICSPVGSWRDVLPIHPAAELFPRMSDDELCELGEDIKANGFTSQAAIYRDGDGKYSLLDARNRLDAVEAVGMRVAIRIGDSWCTIGACDATTTHSMLVRIVHGDPYAYVISANIHRRHLTAEDKRFLIAKLLKATPEKSNRQIAKTVKASHVTVGAVRAELEGRGQIDHVETRTDTKGRNQPAHKPPPNPKVMEAFERAVMTSAETAKKTERMQSVGNGVDPAESAEQRKAEAAANEAATESVVVARAKAQRQR
jgi:hypothetical protein